MQKISSPTTVGKSGQFCSTRGVDIAAATCTERPDGPALHSYVLAELRCAAMRARLVALDIDCIGVALANNWITAHDAIAAVADARALDYVVPTPPEKVAP